MSLFTDFERVDTDAASYLEPHYTYLNRSARTRFADARNQIDEWFEDYKQHCPDEAERLRGELTSTDNQTFLAAYTELYAFALLRDHGYDIECHPVIPGTDTHPEFLVSKDGKASFYVECRAVIGSRDAVRNKQFENEILDAVNQVNSPDYLISVEIKKADDARSPGMARLKRFLQSKVNALNYDAVAKDGEEGKFPSESWIVEGWEIDFSFSAVTEEARTRRTSESRVVGIHSAGMRWINSHELIHRSIERKATKYGNLPLPYLIVLNVIHDSDFFDEDTMMCALFGEEQLTVTSFVDGTDSETWHRSLNGAFVTPAGPKNTRVSGVYALERALPWQEGNGSRIWLHPHASRPFDTNLIKKPYMIHDPETDRMEEHVA